jgi:hypothetical protein
MKYIVDEFGTVTSQKNMMSHQHFQSITLDIFWLFVYLRCKSFDPLRKFFILSNGSHLALTDTIKT